MHRTLWQRRLFGATRTSAEVSWIRMFRGMIRNDANGLEHPWGWEQPAFAPLTNTNSSTFKRTTLQLKNLSENGSFSHLG